MFTAAPRPQTAPLLRAWAKGAARAVPAMDADLWSPPGRIGSRHWLARGAWALERVAAATARAPATVWLPGDFCFGSTSALRAAGHRLVFYPVTSDAAPDWNRCRALAESTPVDVFVLVHTFGIAGDVRAARSFADGHGAVLLEDAAHVLRPDDTIGCLGDAVFFSPHKWIAAPDGAMLWLRDGLTVSPPPKQKTPTARWALKRLIQDLLPDALQPTPARHAPLGFHDDPPDDPTPPPPGISPVATGLLSTLTPSVLDAIAEARRTNHAAWAEALEGIADIAILPAPDAPYRCVIVGATTERAEAVFTAARAADVPAETWPDVPPVVAAGSETHASTLDLRRRRVLLPVHQDLDTSEILSAGRAMAASL